MNRLPGAVVVVTVLLAGCGIGQDPKASAALCQDLARDLAAAGLAGTPTAAQARETGKRLDPRVTQRASPTLHDAVTSLHQRLHAIEVAYRRVSREDVARLATQARADAQKAARACGVPADRFVTS